MTGAANEDSDGINTLPDELILSIFKILPLDTLLECESVCHRWGKLVQDASLWKNKVIVYSGKPGQSEVSEKNLEILTTHKSNIRCVKLQYVYNYPFIQSVLEQCKNLTWLELVMCRISAEFEDDIRKWPKLKKICLKNTLLIQTINSTEMLIQFNQFQGLTYLALADFGLSSVNCKSLIQCPNLCHIFIDKIKNLSLENVRDLILAKQKKLISLHIYGGSAIDDKCLGLLGQCQMLKDLAIIRCESLTDKGLLSLGYLKQVVRLQLWNNVNFSEMALLSTLGSPNFTKLRSLSLSRIANISPVIVDIISEYFKDLKFLALYQCPRIINTDYEKQLKAKFRNIDVVLY